MYKKLALTCLCLMLGSLSLAKSGYYRWVDDNGQPHFTQKPPLDRPYTFVKTQGGVSQDDIEPELLQSTPPKRADSAPSEKPESGTQQYQVLPDKDPERCAQARDALQSFSRGQRVRVQDDDGEYRLLNSEEQTEQKQRAQEAVDIYC